MKFIDQLFENRTIENFNHKKIRGIDLDLISISYFVRITFSYSSWNLWSFQSDQEILP